MDLKSVLETVPVIPVLTIERVDDAVPLARALVAGGLPVLEVTLRTEAALAAIERIAAQVEDAIVGAGTIVTPDDLKACHEAGSRFAVSPGLTEPLAKAAQDSPMPLLPGVMTPSEAMTARHWGFRFLKLFPAKVAGGKALLKAMGGPLGDLVFCPTGGIGPDTFREYLELPNVVCVGGSWVAPNQAIADGDWAAITRLAEETSA